MKEFIGFNNIISGFEKRADKGTLSHAHIIVGPEGIGKSLMARKFALKILGKSEERDYADIIHYRSSKASFGVDEVRNIIDEVRKKPYESDKKVIIIHQSNKLTIQAQNALLKTIEEPPEGVFIILLSESLELLLDTIKSRCQIYKLTPLNHEDIRRYVDRLEIQEKDKLEASISYSEGIPGRAEQFLLSESLQEIRNLVINLLNDAGKNNSKEIKKYEDLFSKYKDDKEEILTIISLFIRDVIIYKELEDKNRIVNLDKYDSIIQLARYFSYNKLNIMLGKIEEARNNYKNNVSYSMTISIMLMGLLEG